MRQAALLLLALAGSLQCASEKGAQAEDGPVADPAEAFANRLAVQHALKACVDITFMLTPSPFEATVALGRQGEPVGLALTPSFMELRCPSDVPNVAWLLGGGTGRSWGKLPNTGWRVQAWCQASLSEGGEGGCSSDVFKMEDPAAVAQANSRKPAASQGKETVLKSVARAAKPLHYSVRRLGVELPPGVTTRVEEQMQHLDGVVALCFHARQPDVNVSSNSNFQLKVTAAKPDESLGAPYVVNGGTPPGLVDAMLPCVQALAPADHASGIPLTVRYGLVAEPADKPPGEYVQEVDVTVLSEVVEVGVPPSERRAFEKLLVKAAAACLAQRPVEVRGGTQRWTQTPNLHVAADVDAVRRDKVHLLEVHVTGLDPMDSQARCLEEALPVEQGTTRAHASWDLVVKVGPKN